MNIILSGPHQAGKTTLGSSLAKELGFTFIDTDRLIENHYEQNTGKKYSSRTISLEEGEDFFRSLEQERIATLTHVKSTVIALGGGTLLSSINRNLLSALGTLIYIKTPSEIIWERILQNGLPSFLDVSDPKKSFLAMLEKRIPIYEETAHFTLEAQHLSIKNAVSEIKRILHHG